VPTGIGGHGGPPYGPKHLKFHIRCQDVCSRFNLIIIVLVLVLLLEIIILWVARDEYEHEDDDEVLAL